MTYIINVIYLCEYIFDVCVCACACACACVCA